MERGEFDNLPGAGRPLDLGVPGRERNWAERCLDQDYRSRACPRAARRPPAEAGHPAALADVAREETAQAITGRLDVDRTLVEWRRRRVERGFLGEWHRHRGGVRPCRSGADFRTPR